MDPLVRGATELQLRLRALDEAWAQLFCVFPAFMDYLPQSWFEIWIVERYKFAAFAKKVG